MRIEMVSNACKLDNILKSSLKKKIDAWLKKIKVKNISIGLGSRTYELVSLDE